MLHPPVYTIPYHDGKRVVLYGNPAAACKIIYEQRTMLYV